MAIIPPFFLDCVVSIGVIEEDKTLWIGTGFIVGRPVGKREEGKVGQYKLFMVTNKHVLRGKHNLVVRFSDAEHKKIIDYPVNLFDRTGPSWVGHPSEKIDVAAFNVDHTMLQRDSAAFSFFELDNHAIDKNEMKDAGLSEGDAVCVLGFPMGIVSDQANYVIAKHGIISRIRDLLKGQETSYLIDSNIFPGNSGGPVIIRIELSSVQGTKAINKSNLIGIVKSYVPFRDVAVSQQTGNPRVIFEENSGLALVDTVDSIKETVELCFKKYFDDSGKALRNIEKI